MQNLADFRGVCKLACKSGCKAHTAVGANLIMSPGQAHDLRGTAALISAFIAIAAVSFTRREPQQTQIR